MSGAISVLLLFAGGVIAIVAITLNRAGRPRVPSPPPPDEPYIRDYRGRIRPIETEPTLFRGKNGRAS